MQAYYIICVLLFLGIPLTSSLENNNDNRNQKLISSFQIVKFPNDPCVGTGATNGTCYTTQECADKGGTSAGSCADGFGVCCTFLITTCGATTMENSTRWTMPTTIGQTATSCSLNVCPPNEDICSLRLDFTTFVITGPNTVSIETVRRRLGAPVGNVNDPAYVREGSSYATNCQLDMFTATSASTSTAPPGVCGTVTGQHMYIEADVDSCNILKFNLAASAAALPAARATNERGVTAFANRNWDITVSQIECTSATLPPPGCTKYFWGGATRTLTSYNFQANTVHLANQHERFCMRRERGNCIGCFATTANANFAISGRANNAAVFTEGCCTYHTMDSTGIAGINNIANTDALNPTTGQGAAASTQIGFDCVIIPGAFINVADAIGTPSAAAANAAATVTALQSTVLAGNVGNLPAPPAICGQGVGLGIGGATLGGATGVAGNTLAANAVVATQGGAAGPGMAASICTRNVPFTLEFLTDDLEGLGATATISENTAAANNRGFQIAFAQLACSAANAG